MTRWYDVRVFAGNECAATSNGQFASILGHRTLDGAALPCCRIPVPPSHANIIGGPIRTTGIEPWVTQINGYTLRRAGWWLTTCLQPYLR